MGFTSEICRKVFGKFQQVVTVSQACKQQFEEMTNGNTQCLCIKNMYDMEDIAKKTEGCEYIRNDKLFRIVTVGRVTKVAKRMDKINEIAKLLKESGHIFEWTVVGDGSEFESCVKVCKEYSLEDVVHYIGNQSNPYPYMKQSDLFVLVSDSESSSMVINEALIVGTPVLTTNFQAACESVIDGQNGLICERDIESIFIKLSHCINHPELMESLRKYISEHPANNDLSVKAVQDILS